MMNSSIGKDLSRTISCALPDQSANRLRALLYGCLQLRYSSGSLVKAKLIFLWLCLYSKESFVAAGIGADGSDAFGDETDAEDCCCRISKLRNSDNTIGGGWDAADELELWNKEDENGVGVCCFLEFGALSDKFSRLNEEDGERRMFESLVGATGAGVFNLRLRERLGVFVWLWLLELLFLLKSLVFAKLFW